MFKKWICQNKNWVFQNFPFLENDFDALTDYELFCKMVEYAKSLAITNEKFLNELKNDLDTMYNEGKFDSLIMEIINLQTTFTFNNVAEMKIATNLLDGCFAKTCGYYQLNDGGASFYKIRELTENDTIDEMFLIEITDTNLVAELLIGDILNVRQVGIKGDSNVDVTESLTSVLSKGLNIYFPQGTYIISSPITLDTHKLIGDSTGDTIIKYQNISHNELFNSYNLNNLEIKNIVFDLGSVKDVLKTSINLYANNNVRITDCEFKNGYGSHFRLNGSQNVLIENCYFHDITGDISNMGNCLYCHPVKNLTVRKCRCNNVMEDFIYLDGDPDSVDGIVENVYIDNCYINNTGHNNTQTSPNAIGINGDCRHIVISNNIITNGCNGIKTDVRYNTLPSDINIYGNIISNNSQNGMTIKSNDNFINDNKISYSNQDGIYVRECNNTVINNNIINNSSRYGIFNNGSYHVNINNCICYDNYSTGIFIGNNEAGKCYHININNCECFKSDTGNQATGIFVYHAEDVKVLSCKCYNNTVNYDLGRPQTINLVSQLNPSFTKNDVRSLMYSNAIPNSGSYNVGDIILYDTPTPGGYVGAVCTTAGAPGTWKEFGSIES